MLQCHALGQPLELDHRLKRFDGVYRWMHAHIAPLRDDGGRHEWGQFNIHVNVIAPAAVTASMLKSIDPKNAEMILERFPLRRFGDPEKDIAPVVVFLSGPDSGYMTGNTISVDGGVAMVV